MVVVAAQLMHDTDKAGALRAPGPKTSQAIFCARPKWAHICTPNSLIVRLPGKGIVHIVAFVKQNEFCSECGNRLGLAEAALARQPPYHVERT